MQFQKNILSGVTVTNKLQLGNYIGALKQWKILQEQHHCYFFAADLHALTVPQDPKILREQTLINIACYIAAGIDPNRSTIFLQSQVPQHAELSWILNCFAHMGELSRMTQFKDKSERATSITVGLFTYPLLMAADILLYDAHLVPVGADQKQHLELTRDLAQRMNHQFADDTFVVPDPMIPKVGARIMDLQEPDNKMSKSASSEMGAIFLTDAPKEVEKKFKRAVTDSGTEIKYTDDKPGIRNLLEIQRAITGKSVEELEGHYLGKQYGHLKVETAAIVIEELRPFQERLAQLLSDKGELDRILKHGREKAQNHAHKTLKRVYERVGLLSN